MARHKSIKIVALDPYLIAGFNGCKLAKSTLDDAMQRFKKRMAENDLDKVYWGLHKLKSKGISDSEDKTIAGHKTEAMRQKYDTKIHSKKPAK